MGISMLKNLRRQTVRGVILDYGGTLDSRGVHWSEVIWKAYEASGVPVSKEQFRESYVEAERELARHRHILPQDDFHTLLLKKMRLELGDLAGKGLIESEKVEAWAQETAAYCDRAARECIEEARPVLETLSRQMPLMLVSNFYGNIDSVLRAYDIRQYFKGIIESAVVGVRKPNPTLFQLGVVALELNPGEVLVVGDSLHKDIEPAEMIGCQVMWLKGKGWTDDEDAYTHSCMISDIGEVLKIVEKE